MLTRRLSPPLQAIHRDGHQRGWIRRGAGHVSATARSQQRQRSHRRTARLPHRGHHIPAAARCQVLLQGYEGTYGVAGVNGRCWLGAYREVSLDCASAWSGLGFCIVYTGSQGTCALRFWGWMDGNCCKRRRKREGVCAMVPRWRCGLAVVGAVSATMDGGIMGLGCFDSHCCS